MTIHILLVEDEVKLARFVELELSSEGYQVSVAHDGMSGLTLARESAPDLAILDWMMPGLTGVELCRRLRATGSKLPVILLTAKDDVSDRVAGLDAGADDYVVDACDTTREAIIISVTILGIIACITLL